MNRAALERHQVWLYLLAIAFGLGLGTRWPVAAAALEALVWPTLALLLFATFLQVPLLQVRQALRDRRFAAAVVLGNFVLVPLLVWVLVEVFALSPSVRLGVLLVLLVPCTDWFITFCHLGRADVARALAVTPLNLVMQLALLPVYLGFMSDAGSRAVWSASALLPALLVVLAPLAAAVVVERFARSRPGVEWLRKTLAGWPVPLLALVVGFIAAAQVGAVKAALAELWGVLPLFALYLLLAALLGRVLSTVFQLPVGQGRTLAFSLSTRNSFLVLPLALSLPAGWELAAVVVVAQSLVELLGLVLLVRGIPEGLFRQPVDGPRAGRGRPGVRR